MRQRHCRLEDQNPWLVLGTLLGFCYGLRLQPLSDFLEKLAILMRFDYNSHGLEPFERTSFLTFKSQLKKLNWLIVFLITI